MSYTTAQKALVRAVQSVAGRPSIAYPNHVGRGPKLPRWVVQVSANTGRTRDLCGTTDAVTEIIVRVETEDGKFCVENDALVDLLCAAFPVGREIDGVLIEQAPQPRPALEGDGVYAVPVIIRGRHFF